MHKNITLTVLIAIIVPKIIYADLIPTGNNPFYYQMGGGQDVPVAAYSGNTTIPLHVDGDVGLGYNCGLFNPKLSITNSLNAVESSFQNVEQSIVQNATAAIAEFPMYAIAHADPDLYNLLNTALLGARRDLELSTKTCQVMQGEIAKGQNPYADWASISMGSDWKYKMSLASNNNLHANSDDSNSDINQVSQQIVKDNGNNGVPWVDGENIGRNGFYADGQGQPPISVIQNTSIAGYNVILQSGRNYDDTSAPARTDANSHLIDTWDSPTHAATWITTVLGDEKITTYVGGDKQSTPGIGLLPANQQLTTQVQQNLQNLITNQTQPSIQNLQAISAPGVMINSSVVHAIQQKDSVTQSLIVNKLSQEVATSKVIDEALLAKQILEEGSQVPAIYGNKVALETIQRSIMKLDQAINNLLFSVHVRKELVSDTVTQLLQNTHGEEVGIGVVQPSKAPNQNMQNGAITQSLSSK